MVYNLDKTVNDLRVVSGFTEETKTFIEQNIENLEGISFEDNGQTYSFTNQDILDMLDEAVEVPNDLMVVATYPEVDVIEAVKDELEFLGE